jgi:hypothetical protein
VLRRYTEEQITEMERIARALNDKIRTLESGSGFQPTGETENDSEAASAEMMDAHMNKHKLSDTSHEASNRSLGQDPFFAGSAQQNGPKSTQSTQPAGRKQQLKDKDYAVDQSPDALAAAIFAVEVCCKLICACKSLVEKCVLCVRLMMSKALQMHELNRITCIRRYMCLRVYVCAYIYIYIYIRRYTKF